MHHLLVWLHISIILAKSYTRVTESLRRYQLVLIIRWLTIELFGIQLKQWTRILNLLHLCFIFTWLPSLMLAVKRLLIIFYAIYRKLVIYRFQRVINRIINRNLLLSTGSVQFFITIVIDFHILVGYICGWLALLLGVWWWLFFYGWNLLCILFQVEQMIDGTGITLHLLTPRLRIVVPVQCFSEHSLANRCAHHFLCFLILNRSILSVLLGHVSRVNWQIMIAPDFLIVSDEYSLYFVGRRNIVLLI